MPPASPSSHAVGQAGEAFVACWLQQQGWQILERRWRCRWGELDLVACAPAGTLAFVEVKTRSRGSWDEAGLLAINARKQAKLVQAAAQFLGEFPQWSDAPCRFDVAATIVRHRPSRLPQRSPPGERPVTCPDAIAIGVSVPFQGYDMTLQCYIPGAFVGP